MSLRIINAYNAFITPSPAKSWDKYAHAAANVLVGNNPHSPAIEVFNGYLELLSDKPTLVAITGNASASIGNNQVEIWRSIPLPPGHVLRVEGYAYVVVRGFEVNVDGVKVAVKKGNTINCFSLNGDFKHKEIMALKVPPTLRFVDGNWKEMLEKLARHIHLAREAALRGASLVKVRVGAKEYEMWVEEIE